LAPAEPNAHDSLADGYAKAGMWQDAVQASDRAAELAKELGGRAIQFDDWGAEFQNIDVVISSTSAPHYVLDRNKVELLMKKRRNRPLPHPGVKRTPYRILDSKDDVESAVWYDPSLIVERFITEPDISGGFAFRTWVFMGSHERCTRFVGPKPIGKAGDAVKHEPVEVPTELRSERERLGFDFGKFDWIMHDGRAVLIDANRTPGTARSIEGFMSAGSRNLAEGLDGLIRERLSKCPKAGPLRSLARQ